ncbi:MAG: hypothetical protein MZW92_05110 [Comamonadaceae bacterium]|nr:hypothetical protein [Comamonadaceae bacterium]
MGDIGDKRLRELDKFKRQAGDRGPARSGPSVHLPARRAAQGRLRKGLAL